MLENRACKAAEDSRASSLLQDFSPGNLNEDSPTDKKQEQQQLEKSESPGKSQFGGIFSPDNLQQQSGSKDKN